MATIHHQEKYIKKNRGKMECKGGKIMQVQTRPNFQWYRQYTKRENLELFSNFLEVVSTLNLMNQKIHEMGNKIWSMSLKSTLIVLKSV
jgi:hypothetical protein